MRRLSQSRISRHRSASSTSSTQYFTRRRGRGAVLPALDRGRQAYSISLFISVDPQKTKKAVEASRTRMSTGRPE